MKETQAVESPTVTAPIILTTQGDGEISWRFDARNAFSDGRDTRSRALISGSGAAFVAYLVIFTIDWNWRILAATITFSALTVVDIGATPRKKTSSND